MKGAVQLMTLDPCFLRSMGRVNPFGMLASHIVQADPIGCFLDPPMTPILSCPKVSSVGSSKKTLRYSIYWYVQYVRGCSE